MSGDAIECTGVVVEQHRSEFFRVEVGPPLHRHVLCKLSGRMHVNRVRVMVGDTVIVHVTPFDLGRGRIVYRGTRQGAA